MRNKLICKIAWIYVFAFLIISGFFAATLNKGSDLNSIPFVETANAKISLEEQCDGYKQAKKHDFYIVTMCNCENKDAIGEVACDDSVGEN